MPERLAKMHLRFEKTHRGTCVSVEENAHVPRTNALVSLNLHSCPAQEHFPKVQAHVVKGAMQIFVQIIDRKCACSVQEIMSYLSQQARALCAQRWLVWCARLQGNSRPQMKRTLLSPTPVANEPIMHFRPFKFVCLTCVLQSPE